MVKHRDLTYAEERSTLFRLHQADIGERLACVNRVVRSEVAPCADKLEDLYAACYEERGGPAHHRLKVIRVGAYHYGAFDVCERVPCRAGVYYHGCQNISIPLLGAFIALTFVCVTEPISSWSTSSTSASPT